MSPRMEIVLEIIDDKRDHVYTVGEGDDSKMTALIKKDTSGRVLEKFTIPKDVFESLVNTLQMYNKR